MKVVKLWYVYVIEVTATTGRVALHVGIALDPQKRLWDHRAGRVRQTRGKALHKLLGYSGPMLQGDALRLEAALKKQPPQVKRIQAQKWKEARDQG